MTTKHYNFRHEVGLRLIKLLNICLMVVPFLFVYNYYYGRILSTPYYTKGDIVIAVIYLILYYVFGKTYEAFLISHTKLSDIVVSQTLSTLLTNCIIYMIFFLLIKKIPNPLPLLLVWIAQMVISLAWSAIARVIYFKWFPAMRSIIVYDMRQGMESLISEYGLNKKFDIVKTASVAECLDDMSMLEDMEVVFLSGVHSRDRNIILKYCLYHNKTVYMIPRVGDVIMSSAKVVHMFHLPIMRVVRYNPNPIYLVGKRIFDIVVSLIALILLSPVFLITAICIKVTDGGPVFYKQERLTKNGKSFISCHVDLIQNRESAMHRTLINRARPEGHSRAVICIGADQIGRIHIHVEADIPQRASEQKRKILRQHILACRLGSCKQQILPAQDGSDRLLPDLFAIVLIDRHRDPLPHIFCCLVRRAELCRFPQQRFINAFLSQKLFQIYHVTYLPYS